MTIEDDLRREEAELQKDLEIQRILGEFRLDYYSVLGVQPGITLEDIKRLYRKKSLQIHPDKTKNVQAVDAFDVLRVAADQLADDKARAALDEVWADARTELIASKGWTVDDDRLAKPAFLKEWRAKVKAILIEEELAKRVELKREQRQEARKRQTDEELRQQLKRQREQDESWEAKRGERVDSWRKFSKKHERKGKKGKHGKKVLI